MSSNTQIIDTAEGRLKKAWFPNSDLDSNASTRLFCLPFAGGRAQIYYGWQCSKTQNIQVIPIELPGHGTRFNEPLLSDMHQLTNILAHEMSDYMDRPYFIFGHSMGGKIAYFLYQEIINKKLPPPSGLFFSACNPPTGQTKEASTDPFSDEALINYLKRMGGTPSIVLSSKDMLEVYLPILRADLQLATYDESPLARIQAHTNILEGTEDSVVTGSAMQHWRSLCSCDIKSHRISGGHFFVKTHNTLVLDIVIQSITNIINTY